jgi:hypothetical protein
LIVDWCGAMTLRVQLVSSLLFRLIHCFNRSWM